MSARTVEQIAWLVQGETQAGLLIAPVDEPALSAEVLLREPFLAGLPGGCCLTSRGCLRLLDFAQGPVIWFPRSFHPGFSYQFQAACTTLGYALDITYEVTTLQECLHLIREGRGITFTTKSAESLPQAGMVFRTAFLDQLVTLARDSFAKRVCPRPPDSSYTHPQRSMPQTPLNRRQLLAGLTATSAVLASAQPAKHRNVIFILSDDHRYDAMGFLKAQPWLETPQMDRLAREGAHFKNAFVTTALCSPSRASILTGVYAHRHRIVDNNTPIPNGTVFFPSYLQKAGYKTGFFGKWHMGAETDEPKPGFDRWVSFRGQGTYLPNPNGLNIDGKKVPQKGYITDELTDYALDWLRTLPANQPYFLYLSHKAVHADFEPAARHKGRYKDTKFVYPPTMEASGEMAQHRPMWVQNQRNSWHGVDYPYHSSLDIAEYYKRYAETLLAVDESIGRVLDELKKRGELDSTLVIYMGDNGFAFGEHGLIDKRTAYEESMRVPLLARCPELFRGGQTVKQVVAGLDIMPTVLAAAGAPTPSGLDGMNWLPLAQGSPANWRTELLYEYYWERNFPQTPTMHALRGDRYKFIRYQGIWDADELYDLQEDPLESRNLIFSDKHQAIIKQMREHLFDILEQTQGMNIPLQRDKGAQQNLRDPQKGKAAQFPQEFERKPNRPAQHN